MSPLLPLLFPVPEPPARPRRVLAHAVDHGEFPDGRPCGQFVCRKCGWDSRHIAATHDELRHGIPCVTCNNPKEAT